MIIHFTDGERVWLVPEPGNWHVAEGAPEEFRRSINEKLAAIERQKELLDDPLALMRGNG